jgi:hypothetical protein
VQFELSPEILCSVNPHALFRPRPLGRGRANQSSPFFGLPPLHYRIEESPVEPNIVSGRVTIGTAAFRRPVLSSFQRPAVAVALETRAFVHWAVSAPEHVSNAWVVEARIVSGRKSQQTHKKHLNFRFSLQPPAIDKPLGRPYIGIRATKILDQTLLLLPKRAGSLLLPAGCFLRVTPAQSARRGINQCIVSNHRRLDAPAK